MPQHDRLTVGIEDTGETDKALGNFIKLDDVTLKLAASASKAALAAAGLSDGLESAAGNTANLEGNLKGLSSVTDQLGISAEQVAGGMAQAAKSLLEFQSRTTAALSEEEKFTLATAKMAEGAQKLADEITALNEQATLNEARAASEEYREAQLKLAASTEKLGESISGTGKDIRAASDDLDDAAKSGDAFGSNLQKLTNISLLTGVSLKDMAGAVVGAAKGMIEFSAAGAQSIDTGARFSVTAARMQIDMTALRESVRGAFDDTTLQSIAFAAGELGVTGDQLEDLGDIATAYSRGSGKDLKETFETLTVAVSQGEVGGLKPFGKGVRELVILAA